MACFANGDPDRIRARRATGTRRDYFDRPCARKWSIAIEIVTHETCRRARRLDDIEGAGLDHYSQHPCQRTIADHDVRRVQTAPGSDPFPSTPTTPQANASPIVWLLRIRSSIASAQCALGFNDNRGDLSPANIVRPQFLADMSASQQLESQAGIPVATHLTFSRRQIQRLS